MPTVSHSPAQHHYAEAERILAVLGSLGADEERPPERPSWLHACAPGRAAAVIERD